MLHLRVTPVQKAVYNIGITAKWRPLPDSNRCYNRERVVSWASRRRGQKAEAGFVPNPARQCKPSGKSLFLVV